MNQYTDQDIADGDLQGNETGSTFTRCRFTGDSVTKKNLVYAVFDDCTFDSPLEACNLSGAEGSTVPQAPELLFNVPPADGVVIAADGKQIGVGDGVTVGFPILTLTVNVVTLDGVPVDPADYDVTGDCEGCNLSPMPVPRAEWLANRDPYIEMTTDATDSDADEIPDIPADGTSTCKLTVQKYDADGNPMTGAGDIDKVSFRTNLGALSVFSAAMVKGKAEITLRSSKETAIATIAAKTEKLGGAEIQVQFTPV